VDAVCRSCPGEGAGYTTVPYQAATSASSCVCIPGYGMSDTGLCRICPAGTFSEGISKEDCAFCPFGHTSAPGSRGREDCVPASQPCPVGQVAPYGAVSSDQCVCLPGHGGKLGLGCMHTPVCGKLCATVFILAAVCSSNVWQVSYGLVQRQPLQQALKHPCCCCCR
jgi:hypothetical protein